MDREGKFELTMFNVDNKFKWVLTADNVREYGKNKDSANYCLRLDCRTRLFMM